MATKKELADGLTVPQLRKLAADNDLDLGDARKKEDIAEAVAASRKVSTADLEAASEDGDEPTVDEGEGGTLEHDASPTGASNLAGIGQSQLDTAPPMREEHGTNIPAPNLRQPVIEEALPSSGSSPDALDPALTKPEEAARERVEGRTSDAASRKAGVHVDDVPPDLGAGVKPSDGGVERYPFPPQGDVDVATVDPGKGKDEYFAPLEVEDWVILDGSHELVPDRLDGRRAVVLDAPRYLVPVDKKDEVWIQVQTRDEVNARLSIPLSAVKEIQKGGLSPAVRG